MTVKGGASAKTCGFAGGPCARPRTTVRLCPYPHQIFFSTFPTSSRRLYMTSRVQKDGPHPRFERGASSIQYQDFAMMVLPEGSFEKLDTMRKRVTLGVQRHPQDHWECQDLQSYLHQVSLMFDYGVCENDIPLDQWGLFWRIRKTGECIIIN
jgi:hypothetical protein